MTLTQLAIPGVWLKESKSWEDQRGSFREMYKASEITAFAIGSVLQFAQVNQSSSQKGVIRGVHVTLGPAGQEKYVFCSKGAIWDVAIDLRPDSKTYGLWCGEVLSDNNGKSLVIPRGVGHAFLALESDATVTYLCSSEYAPEHDLAINPLDPTLNISFREMAKLHDIEDFTISTRDTQGLSFQEYSQAISSYGGGNARE
jgi:dTDP-4-dehydrorhamnose 3,5-epimerase